MKRILLGVVLPVCLAAAVLGIGVLAPKLMLQRQQERAVRLQSRVPISDVRPYGEDYEEIKTALLDAIALSNQMQALDTAVALYSGQMSEAELEAYSQELDRFFDFWASLQSALPWLLSQAEIEGYGYQGRISLDGVLDGAALDGSYICGVSFQGGGVTCFAYFDPVTGVPLWFGYSGPYLEEEPVTQAWDEILAAYSDCLGIAFQTTNTGEDWDVPEPENQAMVTDAEDNGTQHHYGNDASSADSVFRLEEDLNVYFKDGFYSMDVRLN